LKHARRRVLPGIVYCKNGPGNPQPAWKQIKTDSRSGFATAEDQQRNRPETRQHHAGRFRHRLGDHDVINRKGLRAVVSVNRATAVSTPGADKPSEADAGIATQ
jgi:hypothetical protein